MCCVEWFVLRIRIRSESFSLHTKTFFTNNFTAVGYHPTGIKPVEWLDPGWLTSNTARQLLRLHWKVQRLFVLTGNATPLLADPPCRRSGIKSRIQGFQDPAFFYIYIQKLECHWHWLQKVYGHSGIGRGHSGLLPTTIWSVI